MLSREEVLKLAQQYCYYSSDSKGRESFEFDDYGLYHFANLIAAAERERCVKVIENHQIPVGNSAAGEMACEWTYAALKEIRDALRGVDSE